MTRPEMLALAQAIQDVTHMASRLKNMPHRPPDDRDRLQAADAVLRIDVAVKPLYLMIGEVK